MIVTKKPDHNLILKNIDMEISEMRFASLDSEWRFKNAVSRSTRIYLPVFGEGFLDFEGNTISVTPGKIYVIPAMLNFSYRCEDRLDKFYAHVSFEKNDGFDALEGVKEIVVLEDKGECDAVKSLFDEASIGAALNMKSIFLSIIVRAINEYGIDLGSQTQLSQLSLRAIDYINSHLTAKLKIAEIADSLFVSRLTLSNTFSADMNISIGKYIDDRLMISAERDLTVNKLSIKEISEKYGFCDRFYFTRRFTEKFGKPPKQYLKENRYQIN